MRILLVIFAIVVSLTATLARADEFAEKVDLKSIETISIQHNQTLKTFDSYARQTLSGISGRTSLDDQSATYVVLDMVFRPEGYVDRPLIKIKNVPLRADFGDISSLSVEEKHRIVKEGTISLRQYMSEPVQELLGRAQATAVWKADAVNQVAFAAQQLADLTTGTLKPFKIIAPATAERGDHLWHDVNEVLGNMPTLAGTATELGQRVPPPLANYGDRGGLLEQIFNDLSALNRAWVAKDVNKVNESIGELAEKLPQVNPAVYPSYAKRKTEVIYNRLAKLTLPGAAFYFIAFICFLMAARSNVGRLRKVGLVFFIIGFVIHTIGIGLRWWLVEKSVGNWFESIPIKNQFESVLFSAWFGALVGLILEVWKKRSIFGAAASFVGWLSLTAIFATPFVFKREIGGEIGQVSGVLMSYWLYIHVTMVTAAYALIGMSFCLGVWWLVRYYVAGGGQRAAGSGESAVGSRQSAVAGEMRDERGAMSEGIEKSESRIQNDDASPITLNRSPSFLATLDACNLVVLQLAFWVLGVGIILGAIWADQSWGRPWGWDPKETFALVTWIVYLIVVHVRVVTADKAWWTAVLSVVGFFIMLFNWVGVNFFLVGLHSYA